MRRWILIAALLLGAPATGWAIDAVEIDGNVEVDGSTWTFGPGNLIHDIRSYGVKCDLSEDARALLALEVGTGGRAAGATVFLPSRCKVLMGSPGAGNSALELAANTTIRCEDATAGFVLAGRYCDASSTFPGAACTEDTDCLPNSGGTQGSCVYDGNATASFAPTAGSTYTLLDGETGASGLALIGCSVWTQNDNGRAVGVGGSGIRHGYCDGAGGSNLGQACGAFCDSNAGVLEGLACTDSASACGNAAWCTVGTTQCADDGGDCGSVTTALDWSVAGAGDIRVVDWANHEDSEVVGVRIRDHARGDFTVRLGPHSDARESQLSIESLTAPQHDTWLNYTRSPTVQIGLDASSLDCHVEGVEASGWDSAVVIGADGTIHGSDLSGYGSPTDSGMGADDWKGTVGLLIAGGEVVATNNYIDTFIGILPESGTGFNFLAMNNRVQGGVGPKFVCQGAGNQYQNNYAAWGSVGAIVAFGDPRGYCGGGPRQDELCLMHAGEHKNYGCPFACSEDSTKACIPSCNSASTNEGTYCDDDADCPSGACDHDYDCTGTCQTGTAYTCEPSPDFPIGSTNHAIVSNNLLHTDGAATDKRIGVTYLAFTGIGRCNDASAEVGERCSDHGDCTGGLCNLTYPHAHGTLEGNIFYGGGNSTAVEFPDVEGISSISGFKFDNHYHGFDRVFVFPAAPGYTIDNLDLAGLLSGVTTPLTNWDWAFGDISKLAGLAASDDQVQVVTVTAGASVTKGEALTQSGSADSKVVPVAASITEKAIGIALTDASSDASFPMAALGRTRCLAGGAIARQDLLKISGTTDGRFVSASSGEVTLGVALEGATSGTEFACFFTGPSLDDAAAFPKMASAESTGSTNISNQACTSADVVASITHTAGNGNTVVLQGTGVFDRTGGSGSRTLTLAAYDGGASNDCDNGGTQIGALQGLSYSSGDIGTDGVAVPGMWITTGDGTSKTYNLCACTQNGTWSGITVPDASFLLMEYQG